MLSTPPFSAIQKPSAASTRFAARYDAGTIAVCRAGSVVALHIGTPQGVVLVTMRELDFVRGARGPADHHGNPFRTIEQLDAERRGEEVTLAPIEQMPAPRREGHDVREAKYQKAWAGFSSGVFLSLGEAAKSVDVSIPAFGTWVRANHQTESRELIRQRWGQLRARKS